MYKKFLNGILIHERIRVCINILKMIENVWHIDLSVSFGFNLLKWELKDCTK